MTSSDKFCGKLQESSCCNLIHQTLPRLTWLPSPTVRLMDLEEEDSRLGHLYLPKIIVVGWPDCPFKSFAGGVASMVLQPSLPGCENQATRQGELWSTTFRGNWSLADNKNTVTLKSCVN